jgi:hypothetical protein
MTGAASAGTEGGSVIRYLILVAGTLALTSVAAVEAQDLKAEEAAIRALIERQNETGADLPVVPGQVFWSGAYKEPVMGGERPEEVTRDRAPSQRVPGTTRSRVQIRKLEIAASGDMAWEYSTGEMTFELKVGTKGRLTNSYLRVWRRVDGGWKVAAVFSHPHVE